MDHWCLIMFQPSLSKVLLYFLIRQPLSASLFSALHWISSSRMDPFKENEYETPDDNGVEYKELEQSRICHQAHTKYKLVHGALASGTRVREHKKCCLRHTVPAPHLCIQISLLQRRDKAAHPQLHPRCPLHMAIMQRKRRHRRRLRRKKKNKR